MADERGSDHLARLQSAARSDRILRMEKRRELMRTMSTQWGFGTPEAVTLLERHDRRATGAGVGADGRVSAVARLGLKISLYVPADFGLQSGTLEEERRQ